jgi:hypothetical protein
MSNQSKHSIINLVFTNKDIKVTDVKATQASRRRRNLGTFWWYTPAFMWPCDRVAWLQTGEKKGGSHSKSSTTGRTTVHGPK